MSHAPMLPRNRIRPLPHGPRCLSRWRGRADADARARRPDPPPTRSPRLADAIVPPCGQGQPVRGVRLGQRRLAELPGEDRQPAVLADDLGAGAGPPVDRDEDRMGLLAKRIAHEQPLGRRDTRRRGRRRRGGLRPPCTSASSKRSARRSRSAAKQSWPRPSTRSPRYSSMAVSACSPASSRQASKAVRSRLAIASGGCRACPVRCRGSAAGSRPAWVSP